MNDIEGFEIHPERFIAQGHAVAMLGRYRGTTAHATGKPLDAQAVHVWDLRDGKAVRFQQYIDTLQMRVFWAPPEAPGALDSLA